MRFDFFSDGLKTDGEEYDVLCDAAKSIKGIHGLCLEIGTRRAGGTKKIIDALLSNGDLWRSVVCLDPYGNIPYATEEGRTVRIDYTNEMRSDTLRNLYKYVHGKPVHVYLLILEDTEYFKRFSDGYPIYDNEKRLINEYALVFFDGPHDVQSLITEIEFFHPRTPVGGVWVFDDIQNYPHDQSIETWLFELGWKRLNKKAAKASYVRTR